MIHRKYAPLIGKELTWETIKKLMEDIRLDVHAEQSVRSKPKRKRPVVIQKVEDDGA